MNQDNFTRRHIGPRPEEVATMLNKIGVKSIEELIDKTIPSSIRLSEKLDLDEGISEYEFFKKIRHIESQNKIYKSYIGMGYYDTITPAVILRNILENPSWYTSYTPYQAEISQGRLEALLNFQTMIIELTGMEIANASLLDEATAAAEAMIMMYNIRSRDAIKNNHNIFFVDENIFPQTLDVLITRAEPLGIELHMGDYTGFDFPEKTFGAFIQYPAGDGKICDYSDFVNKAHSKNVFVGVAADLLSLSLLTPPGEWGADIVVGSTQRFGVPMGFGGPHAAYFATKEAFKRNIPGRIIGVSVDAKGEYALRMALQTREQHIKRERATSNICTAQALLAIMAGMYAVYHGKEGLVRISSNIHSAAGALAENLNKLGYKIVHDQFFDTLKVELPDNVSKEQLQKASIEKEFNLRYFNGNFIGISIDETTTEPDLNTLIATFAELINKPAEKISVNNEIYFDKKFLRKSDFFKQELFNKYHSETEMMRYIKKLERKDFSLTHSMISLGSCTMKLNAAIEMLPISWPGFSSLHPFIPKDQAKGYYQMFEELSEDLKKITGFDGVSLQPNSGAAGEYTGLMVIRQYHISKGQSNRNVVLIPSSAHGTNPASAVMAGMEVVIVNCDDKGNIDVDDLKKKAEQYKDTLAAFMVTYPSTHGVFEEKIVEMNEIIHKYGGQVYMDGANMNAQVGYTNPAKIGADVCHLNLHKTFAIPHGGGGPGVGPICVAKHLVEFLPSHPVVETGGENGITAVSAAPFGSASILPISYAYIKMMGGEGLTEATKFAILNANYIAASLKDYYKTLYTGKNGFVAHEMILDCRPFKDAGITESDIAKRLMDYGFHAPTLSFPVHGTLMVEPTESESLQELDRFIESMISIYNEIEDIRSGNADKQNNVLKNSPHTAKVLISDEWHNEYSREKAAYPLIWVAENKFFPAVSRIDDAYGDRNLVCTCDPIDSYRD